MQRVSGSKWGIVWMRKFIVQKCLNGERIDKVLCKNFKNLSKGAMHKAFRKRDVKVNGVRVKAEERVFEDDEVEVFLKDEILDGVLTGEKREEVVTNLVRELDVIYEDSNLLVLNKSQGIMVHEDDGDEVSVIEVVEFYLRGKCTPMLCHRLDRNTGGLLMIAKNKKAFEFLSEKIKQKKVKKFYTCILNGSLKRAQDELVAYLKKIDSKGRVFVWDNQVKGSLIIKTGYRVLKELSVKEQDLNFSLVQAHLITGRTHQLRAHFAHIGHPILGDGKYGINRMNKRFNVYWQCLWATRLEFDFGKEDEAFSYLDKKIFEVKPGFKIEGLELEYD